MKIATIRAKLLILLLPFFILSFGVLSIISFYLSNQSLTKSVTETASALGNSSANSAQDTIEKKMIQLDDLASIQRVRTGNISNKTQLAEALSEAQQRINDFDAIVFITPDGSGIRADGTIISYADRDYFKKVLATKEHCISEPLISKTTGKLSIVLAVPVKANGQLTGILIGTYSLDKLSEMLKEVKFMDSGYGYMAVSSGTVVAHPNKDLVGKLNLTEKNYNPEIKTSRTEQDANLLALFKTAVTENKQVTGEYVSSDGRSQFAVFTPFTLVGDSRWVMIVAAPQTEVYAPISTLTKMSIFVSAIFSIMAIIYIFMFSSRFAKPIQIIRDECLLLAKGDLRDRPAQVSSHDEIGQLAQGFREMRSTLRTLVVKIQGQAEHMASSSQELTASANETANAANQVAGSITEIAAGTQTQAATAAKINDVATNMSTNTNNISSTAREVSQIATATSEEAKQGRRAIENAINQINVIGKESAAVQQSINELAKGSASISQIVNLISNIANQTNLLALNAAIEAARAGEQGRGFAVVAEEVRKLAEQSNNATEQIAVLIQENETNMEQAIKAAQAGTNGVNDGITVIQASGEAFNKIVSAVVGLSEQINGISQSINEMAKGTQTFITSVQEIDKVSKENAAEAQTVSAATEEQSATMQEIASASTTLAHLAEELNQAIANFRV
ncbi:MAG: methyl-accepting chemotaxis sensory transducer with Cache sensor [Firmicutes bacterium]|nr:methyl-accepting chemotaxis sensory transducer with Cache sensor [Bacillota bacterium]